ncbi:MAG: DUF3078 domain-containing protein [Bacteroidales bacterium]
MKQIFLILTIIFSLQNLSFAQDLSKFDYRVSTSFGATFNTFSTENGDDSNLDLLFSLLSNFNYESPNFQFDSEFYIQYGQIVRKKTQPEKTQDNFIITLTPSIQLIKSPSIRLFLQSKAETQLNKGYLNDQQTNFADPMFITNTLFVGEKSKVLEQSESRQFNITYGIGYSFQNIIKNKFQLTSEITPSSSAEFSAGPTAVFNVNLEQNFSENINFNLSFNSLLLAKNNFLKSVSNSHFSSMLIASLNIWLINIEYTNRIIYDKELSDRRQLNQVLVLGFKVNL